ncbi:ABC transporter substrate-binding protein [Marisediminicola antarctica]|uniref:Peptide ABC transporter substrate-binding protein n=1 Tax=Marisediminicola antarctica TaxID=674079 RepID=A0A7L5AH07_9MICO|nr:ABC transporter substrate-binding protein [Marisediminicola antarctica]QHO69840.1 peptide ABC transporter substrate-binding protein [Marisediminicola antarctica]
MKEVTDLTHSSAFRRRSLATFAGAATVVVALAGCAGTSGEDALSLDGIVVGTTDPVTSLDPAGSYDNGSFAVQNQVFPFLFNSPYGSPDVEPDIAVSGEFTTPTEFTVVLKDGLTFANGNDLTASDVKFTFDRVVSLADPNGPSSLLGNLDSVEAVDDTTVVFTLKAANDQTFEQILSSPAGPIVDEEVFLATELTDPADIVEGNAFGGQYTITDYTQNEIIQYEANPNYDGLLGAAKTESVTTQYFADETSLKLAVQEGDVDVAYRSLSPTDVADLREDDGVTVWDGPGGEIRYIVFNFNTQPYGAETAEADPAKALAVRQAIASVIDRAEVSEQVYNGTYVPLYSYVPEGLTGATESLKGLYGDGEGGPDVDAAAALLEEAGVTTPVALNLQYSPDHYGASSDDEYAAYASQLNKSELFDVNLESTLWDVYSAERREDAYPLYQLGWFPDYSDADNYLTPFFSDANFLGNHYQDSAVNTLIQQQLVEGDTEARTQLLEDIQDAVASQLSTLPLLQGAGVAVTGTDISGAEDTLDASFKFRYAALSRN